MKVTLDRGETLDVALVENERIIGTLSLELKLKTMPGGSKMVKTSAGSGAKSEKIDGRKRRRTLSPEARARMAHAQKLRWDKKRQGNNEPQQ